MTEHRRVGLTLPASVHPREAARLSADAEAAGAEAIWILDVRREPYLQAAAAISATRRVEVGTNVAVAFARSPAVTAAAAWDLGLWGDGRFVLGLGSQVGPTLAARFGVTADHPGPRMRDYIAAVRGCFAAFRTGRGRYEGEYYTIRRPAFQPGGDDLERDPPVYMAGVNPYMSEIAGEVGDGFAAHPFSTPEYLRDVVRPALARGAERAGRPAPPVLLQLVVAPTRRAAATQMIAYTVPSYRRVLAHSGFGEVADRVIAASGEGRRDEARELIDANYLDHLGVIVGDGPDELAAGIERWQGLAERITLSAPWFGLDDAEQLAQTDRLIRGISRLQ